jgi:hypothetical protein
VNDSFILRLIRLKSNFQLRRIISSTEQAEPFIVALCMQPPQTGRLAQSRDIGAENKSDSIIYQR